MSSCGGAEIHQSFLHFTHVLIVFDNKRLMNSNILPINAAFMTLSGLGLIDSPWKSAIIVFPGLKQIPSIDTFSYILTVIVSVVLIAAGLLSWGIIKRRKIRGANLKH
jgi:hypothetical protein